MLMERAKLSNSSGGEVSDPDELEVEPGATTMWFGKHKGTRLDELDEWYRRGLVHLSRESPSWNLTEFKALHDSYLDWLDERQSPMSRLIWFGKFEGHEMRVIYNAPRRWRWLLNNCDKWGDDLLDIEKRYNLWQQRHPKRMNAERGAANIVHPMGAKLGLEDDELPSDYADDYSSDDGFVVKSSDGEEAEEDQQVTSKEDDLDYNTDVVQIEKSEAETDDDGTDAASSKEGVSTPEDSDSSLPSVADVLKFPSATNSMLKGSRHRKRLTAQSSGRQKPTPENHDCPSDSDVTAMISSPAMGLCRRKRRRLIRPIAGHNVIEDDGSGSDVSPPAKRRRNPMEKDS